MLKRLFQNMLRNIKFTADKQGVDTNIYHDEVHNCDVEQGLVILGKCRCCGKTRRI